MLSLAPRSTQPKWALSETLKIFQPELRKLSIQFDYTIDASYDKQKVDWVMADMVRISQVLVNLMTNAIKFTSKKDGDKKISVAIGASLKKPTSYPPNVVFFEADEKLAGKDTTNNSEWGKGESLYIMVAVRDTGVGISPANQAKLFERFRQATPKTGEMYGGSGLGLNISRKLCQLHGGEVGVSSREAYGSTFGFFFKAHRSEQPSQEAGLDPEELRQKLRASGNMDPADVAEDDVPHDLKEPPTREVTDANPSGSMNDDRLQHTQDIADKAKDEQHESKKQEKEDNPTIARTGVDLKEEDKQRAEAEASQYRDEKPAVLFVEDNLINQKLLKRKMEARGFAVTTANNGREAVDAYLEHSQDKDGVAPFSVVLMDQEMPVMDGNAASREIRRYEEEHGRPSVRIIGVTANVRDEQTKEMRNAGMNDILSKPFRIEELIKKMRLDSGPTAGQAKSK
ncbi:hypothetical protein M8818_004012 [Zalaria obscura]|uniref:Uncharacterized protein n=1 Tax=Zalaria obscura TaxID=2024903 RepID=A0ACC3SCM7_9PEZI